MPPEKRQEILDQLKAAVASFRHCLETQPENSGARRDIELLRQWIRYYSDRWHAHDREKRRQETNLVAFLDFLIERKEPLRESVKALTETSPADAFAEPKRVQDELQEEIAPLKEKIKTELTPKQSGSASTPPARSEELEKGIALLESWASAAGEKMLSASNHLDARRREPAVADQKSALDELEKIWDAVIPFHPLLARDLANQTTIRKRSCRPLRPIHNQERARLPPRLTKIPMNRSRLQRVKPPAAHLPRSVLTEKIWSHLLKCSSELCRRTQLLKLKAEAELTRVEKEQPKDTEKKVLEPSPGKNDPAAAGAAAPKPVDPKELKAGYQKAIELAPKAVERMERA